MQRISPAIGDFGMNCAHTSLIPRPLRDGELGLKAAIELRGRQFLPGARSRQFFQSKVDAHVAPRARSVGGLCYRHGDTGIQVPAAASVFAEVARTNLVRLETIAIP